MKLLDHLAHKLRGSARVHESREAIKRSEQIIERIERQEEEARHHAWFARLVMEENDIAPKMRRALRESR